MIDLIDESAQDLSSLGYETVSFGKFEATTSKLFVNSEGQSKQLGFARGHYFILNVPHLSFLMQEHRQFLQKEIEKHLQFLFKENGLKKHDRILCVGIGNPNILPDSFGVRTVEKINFLPFKKNNHIFKIMPNVFASTGLNAFDIINLIVQKFKIDGVILFDSLATSNLTRLGQSVQLNDAGLTPGSAMNNFGKAINKHTLGVPCIAMGVPMMISSRAFNQQEDVVLAEKDVEEKVNFLAEVVSSSVDCVLK